MDQHVYFIKLDGKIADAYSWEYFQKLVQAAVEHCFSDMSEEAVDQAAKKIFNKALEQMKKKVSDKVLELDDVRLENEELRDCVRYALADYPDVLTAYLNTNNDQIIKLQRKIATEMSKIMTVGDKSNGTVDSSLASTRRALKYDAFERVLYREYTLTPEQREALEDGFIYIHDMGARRDTINCCLFDMKRVLSGGFEMGNVWYEEPSTLPEAFDVLASVTLTNASQIYGGFTISEIDNLLSDYAAKSFEQYCEKYRAIGLSEDQVKNLAEKDIENDFDNGFKSLEYKFNTVISSRGDYPFVTISFGLCKDKFAEMAVKSAITTRMHGQGKEGFKKPVLFPKLVFLFDHALHGEGMRLEYLFDLALECSGQVMYPEFLSLTGDGYVASMYKKYGAVISPMCCRAFLSPWFEHGGKTPADEEDRPVYIGRFNIGVVSLNLPLILMKAREEKRDFHEVLDGYLEMIRDIHKNTYRYLSKLKAYTNPVAYTQGGLYGGNLDLNDSIEPLLKSATASFGFTALNELQRLYNQKSLYEDGEFASETIAYVNAKVEEFSEQDHILYNVYGTPAEKLCGVQVKQFNAKYGVVKNVSDRKYYSNSFHCHVSEEITPIEKQESEHRFWDYANGGKIQYVRITNPENKEALKAIVLHAMKLGLYEGINLSLVYCDHCGADFHNIQHVDVCPRCGSREITKIERMCGFLSYTRIHGSTRLNEAKMAEIKDRKSM